MEAPTQGRRQAMTDQKRDQDGAKDKPERKDDKTPDTKKKHQDELLDEGVEETFPASDPVSVKITK
jgi:hypothetical protein